MTPLTRCPRAVQAVRAVIESTRIRTYLDAEAQAVKLGAVWAGAEFIGSPKRHVYDDPKGRRLFGYYFFNAAGLEVGHWLVDFDHFQTFTTPRVWGSQAIANLVEIKALGITTTLEA